ncbi:hypothetical protein [Pseudomonas saudiphocaensis]|uniref:hypothetical protein n=1 Tax=Pseudomonas saudiphocaensis TaxID=1499686 RepID=UPI00187D6BA3|nr:hypothetical protein [Pseudomonas saudiphocaensis]MBE7927631.1 hypothetical protein [Pseudomonas saudiphocaensis]
MTKIYTILIAMLFPAIANAVDIAKDFGAWVVIKSNDNLDLIAVTVNDSGNFIGFRCYSSSKNCIHVLSANTNCTDGAKYPILINSDYSSMSMDAVCGKNGNGHELYLTKYDDIHDLLQKGNNIGFAIPMESGQFKVVRFSLSGSEKAMDYVEQKTAEVKTGETYL